MTRHPLEKLGVPYRWGLYYPHLWLLSKFGHGNGNMNSKPARQANGGARICITSWEKENRKIMSNEKANDLVSQIIAYEELFERTAPQWNCVDFPGEGMHYLNGDGDCYWCGMTRRQIREERVRAE